MGDKNLKAIIVRGTKDVSVANTTRLIELGEHILNRSGTIRTQIIERSSRTYVRFLLSLGDFGNFSGVLSPELRQEIKDSARIAQEHIDSNREREVACANCGIRCKHVYPNPDGGYTFMK